MKSIFYFNIDDVVAVDTRNELMILIDNDDDDDDSIDRGIVISCNCIANYYARFDILNIQVQRFIAVFRTQEP